MQDGNQANEAKKRHRDEDIAHCVEFDSLYCSVFVISFPFQVFEVASQGDTKPRVWFTWGGDPRKIRWMRCPAPSSPKVVVTMQQ